MILNQSKYNKKTKDDANKTNLNIKDKKEYTLKFFILTVNILFSFSKDTLFFLLLYENIGSQEILFANKSFKELILYSNVSSFSSEFSFINQST